MYVGGRGQKPCYLVLSCSVFRDPFTNVAVSTFTCLSIYPSTQPPLSTWSLLSSLIPDLTELPTHCQKINRGLMQLRDIHLFAPLIYPHGNIYLKRLSWLTLPAAACSSTLLHSASALHPWAPYWQELSPTIFIPLSSSTISGINKVLKVATSRTEGKRERIKQQT